MKYLYINQALRMAIGGLGLIYALSFLSNDQVGELLYFSAIATLVTTIISFGLDQKLLVLFSTKSALAPLIYSICIRATMLFLIGLALILLTIFSAFEGQVHLLFVIIALYSSEIFNGAREFLISQRKFRTLFLSQLFAASIIVFSAICLHLSEKPILASVFLMFGGKTFFNIFCLIFSGAWSELKKLPNFFASIRDALRQMQSLALDGFGLFVSALVLQLNALIGYQFILMFLDNAAVAQFGLAQKLFLYAQIPFNIYIVYSTKSFVLESGDSQSGFLSYTLGKAKITMIGAIGIIGLAGLSLILLEQVALISAEYQLVPLLTLLFFVGLIPYIYINYLSKLVLAHGSVVTLVFRSIIVLLCNLTLLLMTTTMFQVIFVPVIMVTSEIVGLLFVICYMSRSKGRKN